MHYEKYNCRNLLSETLASHQTEDKCIPLRYLNLMNACSIKDEKCLQHKLETESTAYEFLKNKSQFLNIAIKTQKYLHRTLSKQFTQTKNALAINLDMLKLFANIAKMFFDKGNYYCALKWINRVYDYFINNTPEGSLKQELIAAIELRGFIIQGRFDYLISFSKKKKERLIFNAKTPKSNQRKYYINKQWYEEYKKFVSCPQNGFACEENTKFPREIDNYELLSGKEMFDDNQFILDSKENVIEINEDEWLFLKSKFGYTNELKVRNDIDKEKVYKVLILNPNERDEDSLYYFRPKYLCINPNDNISSYFNTKFKDFNNIQLYQYNQNLKQQHKKEILFDIMFFFSFTKVNQHFIHEDYLFQYNESPTMNQPISFVFVDLDNFISTRHKDKCFHCQLNTNSIQCKECSNIYIPSSSFQFCSNECLLKHRECYHKPISKYQHFDYNTMQMLLDIQSNDNFKWNGLAGLTNSYKHCNVNSALQCLCHCMGLVHYICGEYYMNEPLNNGNELPLTKAFMRIADQMWKSSSTKAKIQISTDDIVNILSLYKSKYSISKDHQNEHFSSWEFLSDFFALLSKELNRSNSSLYNECSSSSFTPQPLLAYGKSLNITNSIIENLFYIQIRHKNTCKIKTCAHISNEYQHSFFLSLTLPQRQAFRYYIKFKFFKCGFLKPEIRTYEITESTITVGEFKKKHFTHDCIFDIIGFLTIIKHSHPRILNDYEKLFTYWDGKLQLNFPEYDIVLYESSNDHWNHLLVFVYPFIVELPPQTQTSFFDNMFASMGCCTKCALDNGTAYAFTVDNSDVMFYPVRIKVDKNDIADMRDCHCVRETIFANAGMEVPVLCDVLKERMLLYEEASHNSDSDFKYIVPVRNVGNIKNDKQYYVYLCEHKKNIEPYFERYVTLDKEGEIIEEESGISLMDLFAYYQLPQKDVYACTQCRNSTTTVMSISKLPVYLNVHIQRIDEENNAKVKTLVEYPKTVNVYGMVDKEEEMSFEGNCKEEDCEYELYAVNEHRGSVMEGHYVAYASVKGEWYCFDEGSVFKDAKYKNHNSVMLFYKRKIKGGI